jgi:hypothetical protein
LPETARQAINALALRINDDFLYTRPGEDTGSGKTNSRDVQRYGGDRDKYFNELVEADIRKITCPDTKRLPKS